MMKHYNTNLYTNLSHITTFYSAYLTGSGTQPPHFFSSPSDTLSRFAPASTLIDQARMP